jgi:hypothetical protein
MAFIVNAVILAIFGVLFMVMPDFALAQFKSEVYVATLFMARIMGGAFLLIGLLLWFLKDLAVKTQKNIAYLLLAYSIIGFVMGLFGMTSVGVLRANGVGDRLGSRFAKPGFREIEHSGDVGIEAWGTTHAELIETKAQDAAQGR